MKPYLYVAAGLFLLGFGVGRAAEAGGWRAAGTGFLLAAFLLYILSLDYRKKERSR